MGKTTRKTAAEDTVAPVKKVRKAPKRNEPSGNGFSMTAAKADQRRHQEHEKQNEALKAVFNSIVGQNLAILRATEGNRPLLKDMTPADLPVQSGAVSMRSVYETCLIKYRQRPKADTAQAA